MENEFETKDFGKLIVQNPTITKMEKLSELGFDLDDIAKVNESYLVCVRDREKLQKLTKILFGIEVDIKTIDSFPINTVNKALVSFFTDYGLLLT